MRKMSYLLCLVVAGLSASNLVVAAEPTKEQLAGREVVFNRAKGNCLACHSIPNDPKAESPGNIAPPFVMMKERFPDREKLRSQIWDSTKANPKTSMPPFGKHQILTETEIDRVVDYLQSL